MIWQFTQLNIYRHPLMIKRLCCHLDTFMKSFDTVNLATCAMNQLWVKFIWTTSCKSSWEPLRRACFKMCWLGRLCALDNKRSRDSSSSEEATAVKCSRKKQLQSVIAGETHSSWQSNSRSIGTRRPIRPKIYRSGCARGPPEIRADTRQSGQESWTGPPSWPDYNHSHLS